MVGFCWVLFTGSAGEIIHVILSVAPVGCFVTHVLEKKNLETWRVKPLQGLAPPQRVSLDFSPGLLGSNPHAFFHPSPHPVIDQSLVIGFRNWQWLSVEKNPLKHNNNNRTAASLPCC